MYKVAQLALCAWEYIQPFPKQNPYPVLWGGVTKLQTLHLLLDNNEVKDKRVSHITLQILNPRASLAFKKNKQKTNNKWIIPVLACFDRKVSGKMKPVGKQMKNHRLKAAELH